jgi:Right handed beta helix region
MKNILIAFAILLSCVAGKVSTGPPAANTIEIFVNGSAGLDTNSGAYGHPVKTLAKAAQIVAANHWNKIPTTVTIYPGTYRESMQVSGTSATVGVPVTLQATQPGSVIISGSDVWVGWQPDTSNAGMYIHSWPFHFGICALPAGWPVVGEIFHRREMIFLNGKLLTQVLALKDMRAGTFFVDESAGRVYIFPLTSVDISKVTVEVATRPLLFQSYQVPHLTLKGLVFQHANSCISTPQRSAVAIVGAVDDQIEDTTIAWNNWTGLTLYNLTDSAVRTTTVNNNGELGIDGYQNKGITLETVEASFNNWRGAWANFMSWETGGAKFLLTHGGVFNSYTAIGNQGRGIWFDTDNLNISIENAFISKNQVNGILLEANVGPFTISGSKICENNQGGVVTNNSALVTLTGNSIFDNQSGQIIAFGDTGQRTGTNWESAVKFVAIAQNWRFLNNSIAGSNATELLFSIHQSPTVFLNSLNSDDNTWLNSGSTKVFQFEKSGVPVSTDLAGWRLATNQDGFSTFSSSAKVPNVCVAP